MTRALTAAALFTTLLGLPTSDARATEIGASRTFGLGIQLGTPSGLTGKLYLGGRTNAIDFALGAYYGGEFYDTVYAQVSYHWHVAELTSGGGVAIPFRVGVGGWLASGDWGFGRYDDTVILGARVPFGLDFDLEAAPIQFYFEVAFALAAIPFVDASLDAGIGFRYYF